jgi:uncharacterized protein YqjF (DUF2071 family)
MAKTFLTAEWRKLIMANYAVDPALLEPHLPAGTALDLWDGQCYVSLVGFLFTDVRIKSVPVPFHRTFEEVNLRFYVKRTTGAGELRRGVVFLSELVPRFAITTVANTLYGEKYGTVPLRYSWAETPQERSVAYQWKHRGRWNALEVTAAVEAQPIAVGSAEEFFTEHYWGYTKRRGGWTSEYEVVHPRWEMYPVLGKTIDVDFGALYGSGFGSLAGREPESILLAEGSKIAVRAGARIG